MNLNVSQRRVVSALSKIALLAGIVFAVLIPLSINFGNKAKMIQRVERLSSSELFGDEGANIGAPTLLIIEDSKAFIGGPDSRNVYKVDENYLKTHKIYPVQQKTIKLVTIMLEIATCCALIFGSAGLWFAKKSKF